jgi:hypothetical protein
VSLIYKSISSPPADTVKHIGWLRDLAENTGRTVTGQIGAQVILYALGVPPLTGLAAGALVFGWSWLNGMAWRRWGRGRPAPRR